jgi:hypothetical protein
MHVNGAEVAATAAIVSSGLTGYVTHRITRSQVSASFKLAEDQRTHERELITEEKAREERAERLNRYLLLFTASKSSDLLSQSIYREMSRDPNKIGSIEYYKYTAPPWEQFQRAWAEMMVCGSSRGARAATYLMIKMERLTLAAEEGRPIAEPLAEFREALKALLRMAHAELDDAPLRSMAEDYAEVFRMLDDAVSDGDSDVTIEDRGERSDDAGLDAEYRGQRPGATGGDWRDATDSDYDDA